LDLEQIAKLFENKQPRIFLSQNFCLY